MEMPWRAHLDHGLGDIHGWQGLAFAGSPALAGASNPGQRQQQRK